MGQYEMMHHKRMEMVRELTHLVANLGYVDMLCRTTICTENELDIIAEVDKSVGKLVALFVRGYYHVQDYHRDLDKLDAGLTAAHAVYMAVYARHYARMNTV